MKRPTTLLYELVASLTQEEVSRVLFRIKNAALLKQLFDTFVTGSPRNEPELKTLLAGKINLSQLSVLKTRLTDIIMDCLLPSHLNSGALTMEERLYWLIEALTRKCMIRHTIPLMREATQAARNHENKTILLKLMKLRMRLLEYHPSYFEIETEAKSLRRDFDEWAYTEKLERQTLDWGIQIQDALLQPYDKRISCMKTLQADIQAFDLRPCLFLSTELDFLRVKYKIARHLSQWDECIRSAKAFLKACEPFLKAEQVLQDYYHALYQLAILHTVQSDYVTARHYAMKMLETAHTFFSETPLYQGQYLLVMLNLASLHGEKSAGETLCNEAEVLLKRTAERGVFDFHTQLRLAVGLFYHIQSKPREAVRWVLELRNEKLTGSFADHRWIARCIFLCAHYELGNIPILRKEVRAVAAEVQRAQYGGAVENAWLEILHSLSSSEAELREGILEKGIETFHELGQNPELKLHQEKFPYREWMRSQMRHTGLREEMRKI